MIREILCDGRLLIMKKVWTAGQVIGIINDVPSCEELLTRIEKEAEETISRTSSLLKATAKL